MKIEKGIRTRKYEEKIRDMDNDRWVKICWEEKCKEG